MRTANGAALAAFAAASLLLAGCTQAGQNANAILSAAANEAEAAGAHESAAAMRDGKLTEDEYYAAARRLQTCYGDQGVTIEGPILSPVDQVTLEFAYPDSLSSVTGSAEDALNKCIDQWAPELAAYTATHKAEMDESLRLAVSDCLEKAGYVVTGDEKTTSDFMGDPHSDGGTQRDAAQKCIVTNATRLFPDLPKVTIYY